MNLPHNYKKKAFTFRKWIIYLIFCYMVCSRCLVEHFHAFPFCITAIGTMMMMMWNSKRNRTCYIMVKIEDVQWLECMMGSFPAERFFLWDFKTATRICRLKCNTIYFKIDYSIIMMLEFNIVLKCFNSVSIL